MRTHYNRSHRQELAGTAAKSRYQNIEENCADSQGESSGKTPKTHFHWPRVEHFEQDNWSEIETRDIVHLTNKANNNEASDHALTVEEAPWNERCNGEEPLPDNKRYEQETADDQLAKDGGACPWTYISTGLKSDQSDIFEQGD